MAIPETPQIHEVFGIHAKGTGLTYQQLQASIASSTLLNRMPTLAEVANVAMFVASDKAGPMTGAVINFGAGPLVD